MTLIGSTSGHSQAAEISCRTLRAILESARGIKPNDQSDAAKKARFTESYRDFDGLRFMIRVGVQPAENGYKAKNILNEVITPDRVDWKAVTQVPKTAAAAEPASDTTAAPAAIEKPAWAK